MVVSGFNPFLYTIHVVIVWLYKKLEHQVILSVSTTDRERNGLSKKKSDFFQKSDFYY